MRSPSRLVRPSIALGLACALALGGCASGPNAKNGPNPAERMPEPDVPNYPNVSRERFPLENELGTGLIVLVAIAAAGGLAYLNYLAFTQWFD